MFARGCALRVEEGEAGLATVPEQDLLVQLAQQRGCLEEGEVELVHCKELLQVKLFHWLFFGHKTRGIVDEISPGSAAWTLSPLSLRMSGTW